MKLCLTFLLGLLLLGPQTLASPLEATKQLIKRGTLEDLYATVKDTDKVNTGAARSWELYPNKGDTAGLYAPTLFYGCTLVVVANGRGIVIGHFAEVTPGKSNPCLTDQKSVDAMLAKLQGAEDNVDIEQGSGTRAWIVYSDDVPKSSLGYKAIYKNLNEDMEIDAANIKDIPYRRGGGGGVSDKIVVQWAPKSDNSGAVLTVYIRSDTPQFTQTYDCNGNPVNAGSRLMARVGPACTRAPSTSTSAPAATATAASPPPYATGWCGMHVIQYQKNENGDPNHPSNPEYVIDVSLFDAAQKPINLKNCNGCTTSASSVALNGQADTFESDLPLGMDVTCGAVDSDAILFKYGDQSWGSNDQAHHSNFGSYDSGKREGDTGFAC